ncbi:MAG: rhodanese-related sulfurtransferase [Candidatus Neomarinimicrobiota bacterium]|nr:hypothetical protein [Candidatus Neomarinimicrobiota bacterium]|tara:strand:+ start:900 stop:1937 length:1038 start_codon:yes stop_codon:yes gene_type:complete
MIIKNNLFNKIDKEELKLALSSETFERYTVSFYHYVKLSSPESFRNKLYIEWNQMNVFGRVYIASEGINAQVSIPEHNWDKFCDYLKTIPELGEISIKQAIQEGHSFYKLKIKVRNELVAYGVSEKAYDMRKVGKHLSADEYNFAMDRDDSVVVDMRNYYESEIGRFDNALVPDVETSKELLPEVKKLLSGRENDKILLYCTGGIRCEKASSYLLHNGFKDVNQLHGGIIQYAHDIKEQGIDSRFKGKNFVFDDRLGERVTDDVISYCHICKASCDDHTDCKNDACHILFIQCEKCSELLNGCCSKECKDFALLPLDEQKALRKDPERIISRTFFDSRVKPKLDT